VPTFASCMTAVSDSNTSGEIVVSWGTTAGPGSYELREINGSIQLRVGRDDHEAINAGMSRLVQELHVEHRSGAARLPRGTNWIHNASAALWPMRGHQVSTAHYTSSLRSWPEFRKFVSDLAVFGTNQIEVAHIVNLCDATKNCVLPEAALVNFSQALIEANLNVSMWFPLSLCNLSNAESVFGKMPRLDSILHEGGWSTQSGWDTAAACAEKLRRHHPSAGVYAAAAAHSDALLTTFFEDMARPELTFVSGLATHMAPVSQRVQMHSTGLRLFPVDPS
jgi:hypothetical protein